MSLEVSVDCDMDELHCCLEEGSTHSDTRFLFTPLWAFVSGDMLKQNNIDITIIQRQSIKIPSFDLAHHETGSLMFKSIAYE